jgi:hypothetical protein
MSRVQWCPASAVMRYSVGAACITSLHAYGEQD